MARKQKSEGEGESKELERKVSGAARKKVVEAMNKHLDEEEKENGTDGKKSKEDGHGYTVSKQKRNEARKTELSSVTEKKKAVVEEEEEADDEEKKKMTRKERKDVKMKTHGKGMSSKEYCEKNFKKQGREDEREQRNKNIEKSRIPSKRKQDYPEMKETNGRKRRAPHTKYGKK